MAYEINIISFKTQNISTGRVFHTNNIVGNVGEKIRVTIEAQCDEIPNLVTQTANALIQYVLKPKSSPPYATGSPTHIPNSFFKNIHSNGVATLINNRILGAELNVFAGEKHGQLVESPSDFKFEIYDVDLIRYEFDMYILPAITPSDFVGGVYSIPTYFSGAECLTLYFYLQIADFAINVAASVNDVDLSSYFSSGNTGFYNEWLNLGSEYFTLSTWTPPATIDPTLTQTYTAKITQTASGAVAPALNFVADSQIKVMFLQLKDDNVWDVSKTYMENIEFHVLDALANNTVFSSSKIIDFTANAISADTVNISFKIVANALSVGKRYVLWFNVGVESTDGFWATQNTQPHLIYGEQGSSLDTFTAEISFSHWDQEPPSPYFTGLRSFRSDDGLAFCQIINSNTVLNQVQSFTFGFKNKTTNITIPGELFTVPYGSLPFSGSRGRIRNILNQYNEYSVQEVVSGTYQINFGFQAWDGWADANDIVFFCAINVVSNGILDVVEFQSPFIQVGQFATTKNSAAEPQALPLSVEFFVCDAVGNVLIPTAFETPIAGENHLIVATWQDNNLNDLQTTDVIGYLGVCDGAQKTNKNYWRYFYSIRDAETDTPFLAVPLHTAGRAKAEVTAIDTAKVSAVLLWSEYVRIFGENKNPCFDFRLDKIEPQVPAYATEKYMFWHVRNSQTYTQTVLTEPIGYVAHYAFNGFLGIPPSGAQFYINATLYSFASWITALSSAVPGDVLKITVTALPYGSDWLFALLVGTFSAIPAGYKDFTIPFRNPTLTEPQVGADALLYLDTPIEFNPIQTAHDALYLGLRQNPPYVDNYTSFPFMLREAGQPAIVNAAVNALTGNYGVHFAGIVNRLSNFIFPSNYLPLINDTVADRDFKFSYKFPAYETTRAILSYAGEAQVPRYATELAGNSAVYDGVTRFENVTGIPSGSFSLTKDAVFFFSFWYDGKDGYLLSSRRVIVPYASGAGGYSFLASNNYTFYAGWLRDDALGFNNFTEQTFAVAPIKYGYNNVTVIFKNSGVGVEPEITIISNGWEGSYRVLRPTAITVDSLKSTEFKIGTGALNLSSYIGFRGKIKRIFMATGTNLNLPNDMEKRCFQTVGNHNGGVYNGESYFPAGGMDFYADFNFNKTGVMPISVTSSHALSITQFGAISYSNFLG